MRRAAFGIVAALAEGESLAIGPQFYGIPLTPDHFAEVIDHIFQAAIIQKQLKRWDQIAPQQASRIRGALYAKEYRQFDRSQGSFRLGGMEDIEPPYVPLDPAAE